MIHSAMLLMAAFVIWTALALVAGGSSIVATLIKDEWTHRRASSGR